MAADANPATSLEDMVFFTGRGGCDEQAAAVEALDALRIARQVLQAVNQEQPMEETVEDARSCLRRAIDDAQYSAQLHDGLQVGTSVCGLAGGALTLAASLSPPVGLAGAVVSVASTAAGLLTSVGTKRRINSNVGAAERAWREFTKMGSAIRAAAEAQEAAAGAWRVRTPAEGDHLEHILRIYTATAKHLNLTEPMEIYQQMLARFQWAMRAPPLEIRAPAQQGAGGDVASDDAASLVYAGGKAASTFCGGSNVVRLAARTREISEAKELAAIARRRLRGHHWGLVRSSFKQGRLKDVLGSVQSAKATASPRAPIPLATAATDLRASVQAAEQAQRSAAANALGRVRTGLVAMSIAMDGYMAYRAALALREGSPYPARETLQQWHADMGQSIAAFRMADDLCEEFNKSVQSLVKHFQAGE